MHPDTFLFAVYAIITDSICYQKLQKEYFLLMWLLGRPMINKNCNLLKGVNLKAQVYNKFQQTKNKQRWITSHMHSSNNIFLIYEINVFLILVYNMPIKNIIEFKFSMLR